VPTNFAALVIGNAAYAEVPRLLNPVNDAEDMSARLSALDFSVQTLKDATIEQMRQAVVDFSGSLETSSVGLVFFAGHAFQIGGKNYLAAIDTKANQPLQVQLSALDLDLVLTALKGASAPTGFVILDACRNNPFEGRMRSGASTELAPIYAPKGTLIAFSTSPGQTSLDGNGRNGYYTQALLQHISTPNLLIETMFKRVRSTLESLTGGRQTSWEHTSLTGDFRFRLRAFSGAHGYGPTAIADALFPRNSRASGRLIAALKTYNWYTQNPALDAFTTEEARDCTSDELFVTGRNVYQAACGNANAAITYIVQFRNKTDGLEEIQCKAILDGILYEIFFNSQGLHRAKPKMGQFEQVFELVEDQDLKGSFEFLKSCLADYADNYFVIPGTGERVTVSIAADPPTADGKRMLNAIWLDSTNILREIPYTIFDELFGTNRRREFDLLELREFLSEELIIPKRYLTVEPQFSYTSGTRLILLPSRTISRMS
jgi:hypothetical protein